MIGYAFCGSFCTLAASLEQLSGLVSMGYDVLPIMSRNVRTMDTRFFKAQDFYEKVKSITGREPVCTIEDAEPLGPAVKLELLVICPCTGNTLAKLAAGITDTPVCMAAKAHLRSDRPLVIALSTNDALSANMKNIGTMLEKKNVYFVPMKQDDPQNKPHSLVSELSLLPKAINAAKEGKQLSKLFY